MSECVGRENCIFVPTSKFLDVLKQSAFNDGYNKAIDDFVKMLTKEYDYGDCENQIYEAAEQLKERI